MDEEFSSLSSRGHDKDCPSLVTDIPDALLLILATLGSSLGAILGILISKLYLNGFIPTGCGTLGSMVGCSILCAAGLYFWKPTSTPQRQL